MIASSIWVLVILTTVLAVTVAVGLIYFAGTRCRRKSRGQLLYDAPYNYELPPLPPHIQRTDSGIYDTISNGSKDGQQNQPQEQSQSKPLDSKIDNEILAANSCLRNSPLSDENGSAAINDVTVSQFPSTNPDTARISSVHSVGTDSPSERADLSLNLATDTVESLNHDKPRIPSPNVAKNASYQSSIKFSMERNPAYRTNIAIAPEIETSENIAYEHMVSSSQSSATNPDTVVSAIPPSLMHTVETGLSSERAGGTDHSLNLEVGDTTGESTAENMNDEPRLPSPDVDVHKNASHQPSTNFIFERNSAYGTDIAITPEIETGENVAYKHNDPAM